MNKFEHSLLKFFSETTLKKIQRFTIGIAGAGGIGSNTAVNLVRCGFKKFVIADFDTVDFSNLNRQFYFYEQAGMAKVLALKENLLKINKDLSIEAVNKKLDAKLLNQIFKECDVIVEAFDEAQYKTILVEEFAETDKFIVTASGVAGFGDVSEISACKVRENLYIAGDMKSRADENLFCFSPKVNAVSALQADLILDYCVKKKTVHELRTKKQEI